MGVRSHSCGRSARQGAEGIPLSPPEKKPPSGGLFYWRREGDSNHRMARSLIRPCGPHPFGAAIGCADAVLFACGEWCPSGARTACGTVRRRRMGVRSHSCGRSARQGAERGIFERFADAAGLPFRSSPPKSGTSGHRDPGRR
jgi:hypothetical protein